MQLALHECTHAIFVIGCERGAAVLKMWNRQNKNGAGVSLMGLNPSSMLYELSRVPVDIIVPVFKGFVSNPSTQLLMIRVSV